MNKLNLLQISKEVRKDILRMAYRTQSAHAGGALSCVELLVALYFDIMKVNSKNHLDPKRDRLVFSKAHDAKALYAVLAHRGFFDKKILEGYELDDGLLPCHSTRHCVPGIEVSAGSLGHGLSMAAGMAFSGKLDKKSYRVFALLSDGDCDEGSTWEAALFAGHHRLDNLISIIDYNKLQGCGFVKDVLDLEPFIDKWKSFGWHAIEIDGHNFVQIHKVFPNLPIGRPSVIIAHTIKGLGGVPEQIGKVSSQYKPPTQQEFEKAISELSS